jgi:hypothetical protein
MTYLLREDRATDPSSPLLMPATQAQISSLALIRCYAGECGFTSCHRHANPIGAVRRDLSRPGRLHWLTGRRTRSVNWDAFEAPDGQPLLVGASRWHSAVEHVEVVAAGSVHRARRGRRGRLDAGATTSIVSGSVMTAVSCCWISQPLDPAQSQAPEPGDRTSPDAGESPVQLLSLVAQRGLSPANGGQGLMPSVRTYGCCNHGRGRVLHRWQKHMPRSCAWPADSIASSGHAARCQWCWRRCRWWASIGFITLVASAGDEPVFRS